MFAIDEIIRKNKAGSYYINKINNKYVMKPRTSQLLTKLDGKFNRTQKVLIYYIIQIQELRSEIKKLKNDIGL